MVLFKKKVRSFVRFCLLCAASFVLCACSSSKVHIPETPSVDHPVAAPEIKIFYAAQLPAMDALLEKSKLEVKQVSVDSQFSYVCGGVFTNEELIKQVLMDADRVFRLSGVRQEWVPIEGSLDEYFIFSLE